MEDDDIYLEILETVSVAREFMLQQADLGRTLFPKTREVFQFSKDTQLQSFHRSIQDCQVCRLFKGRRTVVFGSGNSDADVVFIGEAPGAEEDRQGLPFVGASGQLLTRMIESIQLSRDEVYIVNVIKCRPQGNRDPKPDEIASCEPYLLHQIEIVAPEVICTLGRFATQALLKTSEPLGKLRGRVFDYQGSKLIPTYHPAALLHNPQWKRSTWQDLKLLRKEYDGLQL